MRETLGYLGAAVAAVLVLTWAAPAGTAPLAMVGAAVGVVVVLVAVKHDPAAVVRVLAALTGWPRGQ